MTIRYRLAPFAIAAAIAGCSAPGTLEVRVYGEEFIEQGIPADEFVDQWAVTFRRFLLGLGDVSAARGHEAPDLQAAAYRVYDVARPSDGAGVLVSSATVPAGGYDHVAYRVAPAPAGAQAANAAAADVDLMTRQGYSIFVEGEATKGAVTKTFAWGFTTRTHYHEWTGITDLWSFIARQTTTLGHIDGEGHCETTIE
jgi:hypothetical protein